LMPRKTTSIILILNFDILAFFGLGEWVAIHYTDCNLVSGLYGSSEVLSQVTALLKKSGSLITSQILTYIPFIFSFCASFNFVDTILAQTFLMFKFLVVICFLIHA
jgi:hypothetical protein